jgi:hypothetical protein
MTLLWLDGFDTYGTTNGSAPSPTGIVGRIASAIAGESSLDIEAGRHNGRSLEFNSDGADIIVYPASMTTNTTLIAGASFYIGDLSDLTGGTNVDLITFNEGTNRSFSIRLLGSGLAVSRGATYLESSKPGFILCAGCWYFIELKAKCSNTVGQYEVRVNGIPVIGPSSANVDTQNSTQGYYDRVRITADIGFKVDDLYVCDAAGSTNNDFLGKIEVNTLTPTSDVRNTMFGGGFGSVDEDVCDDATTYATYAGAPPGPYYFEMGFPDTNNYATIVGVVCTGTLSSDSNMTFRLSANSSGNLAYSGNASWNSGTWTTKYAVFQTVPGTSNAWTPSTVNAAAFGLETV